MQEIFHIYDLDRQQFFLMILVATLVVFVDTTVGILTGTIISMLRFTAGVALGHSYCVLWKGETKVR